MKTLTEVLAKLRPGSAAALLRQAVDSSRFMDPPADEAYVRPPVANVDWPTSARILLIEAPGAVGKSAASRFIAANRDWFLLDSSQMQVGNYGLTGLLADSFRGSADIFNHLREGDVGVVVDALDEAHLKAGSVNFFAFLDDLVTISQTAAIPGVSMVLMARPDTSLLIKLHLQDRGEPLASATLDFFDPDSSRSFIATHLSTYSSRSGRDFWTTESKNVGGFQSLRESRLLSVASVLLGEDVTALEPNWSRLATFLGYAPVLAVLAESLDVSNPFRESQDQKLAAATSSRVLSGLIEALLDREQEKFVAQVGDRLEAKTPAEHRFQRQVLYSPFEQVRRLAELVLGLPPVSLQAPVPDLIAAEYDEAVEQWVKDHPFLGSGGTVNQVFLDYLMASVAMDETVGRDAANAILLHRPGPFFFRFVHQLGQSAGHRIDERLVESLVRSGLEGVQHADRVCWAFTEEGGTATLEMRDGFVDDVLKYEVTQLSGILEIRGPLARGIVVTDECLRLEGRNGRTEVGPSAFVHAQTIIVDSKELIVGPKSNVLVAQDFDASGLSSVKVLHGAALEVVGAADWPLLRPYSRQKLEGQWIDYASYVDLRAILRGFNRQAGGRVSIYAEKLDQAIVKDNERRLRYLSGLQAREIIDRDQSHYVLNTDELARYGVSLHNLLWGQPDSDLLDFLLLLESDSLR